MKKSLIFGAVALLFASCATAPAADKPAAAPAADAAPVADAAPAAATLVVTDFEDPALDVSSYKGGATTITASIQGAVVHAGAGALMIDSQTSDYSGVPIKPAAANLDFTGKTELAFWYKGAATGAKINVVLEDAGLEQLQVAFTDDSTEWKEVVLPLKSFKSRTDWQASNAKINKRADYPLTSVHIFSTNTLKGVVYYDDVVAR